MSRSGLSVQLAQLIRTRQVTSLELTEMYLARLHRYNAKLNCVVTFLDDLAQRRRSRPTPKSPAGKYKGPLHGIPWGAKDIIAVKGYKTTWGSGRLQRSDDRRRGERSRDAARRGRGAAGEAGHGRTGAGRPVVRRADQESLESRRRIERVVGGSGVGNGGGLVAFAIGSETSGSILSPSARCGVTGLRPTFGRVSRYGVMALSWTQDRLGPLCRYAEDCALVMSVIAKPDGRDLSVSELPFNWNAHLDIKKLRVGYLKEAFDEVKDPLLKRQ